MIDATTLKVREYTIADIEIYGLGKVFPPGEYGLLFCEQEDGCHWTLIGDDDYVRLIESASGMEDLSLHLGKFSLARKGWPDEWHMLEEEWYAIVNAPEGCGWFRVQPSYAP